MNEGACVTLWDMEKGSDARNRHWSLSFSPEAQMNGVTENRIDYGRMMEMYQQELTKLSPDEVRAFEVFASENDLPPELICEFYLGEIARLKGESVLQVFNEFNEKMGKEYV